VTFWDFCNNNPGYATIIFIFLLIAICEIVKYIMGYKDG
jgi:hypothetical protein